MSDLLDFSPPGQATFSLAGAKARFYDAGTTTPRTVYADEAETVPHPSPLLADSSGRFAQAFVSGGAVKVVVTQSDDSTGYTLDPCVKVAATGSSASSISFTPSVAIPETNVQDAIEAVQAGAPADTKGAFSTDFITVGALGRGAPITRTADFSVAATENWLINNKSGSACVVTLPAAASFTGREIMIQNLQAQAVNSASSNVIPLRGGSAGTAILPATVGAFAALVSNGTSWQITQQSRNINLGVSVAATSGASIDFTGIPSWASRVTLMFAGLSTSGTSIPIVQIGDSGGIEALNYVGSASSIAASTVGSALWGGTGAQLRQSWGAALTVGGRVVIEKLNDSNDWVFTAQLGAEDTANMMVSSGYKNLSATLDRVRLTTVGGSDTFDTGIINISWE